MQVLGGDRALGQVGDAAPQVGEERGYRPFRQGLGERVGDHPQREARHPRQRQGLGGALGTDQCRGVQDLGGRGRAGVEGEEGGAVDLTEELAQGALALSGAADQDDLSRDRGLVPHQAQQCVPAGVAVGVQTLFAQGQQVGDDPARGGLLGCLVRGGRWAGPGVPPVVTHREVDEDPG